ncbi:DJ-1/PfpI family protein [Paenibacillus harenae]|uniref:Cyclohexyl-isocyanide hydratase n=1 Tax=Paenibacillus harenae TaxID=306543 RepID=A0ABT9U559_PAEHA|nr:DJ-1/PfpI family protein [Paenibacillus harenae]MDQ0114763.1 cyclohexyl-isocyanide hydratase [Paenibacillus harenae]
MRLAFILFDDMTMLDFSGFHNAVTWLKKRGLVEDMAWDYCATKEEISDDRGMRVKVDLVLPHLGHYDVVFLPGGMGTRRLVSDATFIDWLRTAEEAAYKASVCTGAVLLGAAGLLTGKRATTNPNAIELLVPYCGTAVRERYVQDGRVFTGGGITASVDLGLFFIESIWGEAVAADIQQAMDYPYYKSLA